ncbi:MAG: cation diffusion facilitator family transporter [Phycisphaerae bacterium]|jgi:cation diffusion facilitator family transporter
MNDKNAIREIYRITIFGTFLNVLLAGAKIIAGHFGRSASLFTDGLHSLSDLSTDVAVLLGTKFSEKAPDEEHPYGHRWHETLSTLFISAALVAVGGYSIRKAFLAAEHPQSIAGAGWLYAITVISILSKELLYQATAKSARKTHSSALMANAWHHRSDSLSSIAVLAALIATRFGIPYADSLGAGIVGLMILAAALKLLGSVFREFSNSSVNKDTLSAVRQIAENIPEIGQVHRIRSRNVGREVFLDFHMLVAPEMSVEKAHEISELCESAITESLNVPVNIIVHIEPDRPEKRHDN